MPSISRAKAAYLDSATGSQYRSIFTAFDHFNAALFNGALPEVMLTLCTGRRNIRGYFWDRKYQHRETNASLAEISLNPEFFDRNDRDLLSTLAHEMVHHQQEVIYAETGAPADKPGRGGYHNARFADLMGAIGLVASDTGEPGGKSTGQKMSHYIDDDGPFARAYEALAETGWTLDWRAIAAPSAGKKPAKNTKVKFTCPECGANAWGKETLNIHCADCDVPMAGAE